MRNEDGEAINRLYTDSAVDRLISQASHDIACRFRFSDRERRILEKAALGRHAKAIAEEFCVSPNTIGTHWTRMLKKAKGMDRQTLLVAVWRAAIALPQR